MLLAIDLGLRAGLAWYSGDGRLASYRSTHFASTAVLKRGIEAVLAEAEQLSFLVVEGDRRHAELWAKRAEKRGARILLVAPEVWRARLLLPRESRSGRDAKDAATVLARQVIEWSGARRPTSLNDDAAEAILLGLYGVLAVGWLDAPPALAR